ncbi:MAG: hypothetical protein PHZ00_00905 [Candidatus Peribacteraceae bacterium]|nr:hypothetical protein [Candidatus Peribacteraceae bacterium]
MADTETLKPVPASPSEQQDIPGMLTKLKTILTEAKDLMEKGSIEGTAAQKERWKLEIEKVEKQVRSAESGDWNVPADKLEAFVGKWESFVELAKTPKEQNDAERRTGSSIVRDVLVQTIENENDIEAQALKDFKDALIRFDIQESETHRIFRTVRTWAPSELIDKLEVWEKPLYKGDGLLAEISSMETFVLDVRNHLMNVADGTKRIDIDLIDNATKGLRKFQFEKMDEIEANYLSEAKKSAIQHLASIPDVVLLNNNLSNPKLKNLWVCGVILSSENDRAPTVDGIIRNNDRSISFSKTGKFSISIKHDSFNSEIFDEFNPPIEKIITVEAPAEPPPTPPAAPPDSVANPFGVPAPAVPAAEPASPASNRSTHPKPARRAPIPSPSAEELPAAPAASAPAPAVPETPPASTLPAVPAPAAETAPAAPETPHMEEEKMITATDDLDDPFGTAAPAAPLAAAPEGVPEQTNLKTEMERKLEELADKTKIKQLNFENDLREDQFQIIKDNWRKIEKAITKHAEEIKIYPIKISRPNAGKETQIADQGNFNYLLLIAPDDPDIDTSIQNELVRLAAIEMDRSAELQKRLAAIDKDRLVELQKDIDKMTESIQSKLAVKVACTLSNLKDYDDVIAFLFSLDSISVTDAQKATLKPLTLNIYDRTIWSVNGLDTIPMTGFPVFPNEKTMNIALFPDDADTVAVTPQEVVDKLLTIPERNTLIRDIEEGLRSQQSKTKKEVSLMKNLEVDDLKQIKENLSKAEAAIKKNEEILREYGIKLDIQGSGTEILDGNLYLDLTDDNLSNTIKTTITEDEKLHASPQAGGIF